MNSIRFTSFIVSILNIVQKHDKIKKIELRIVGKNDTKFVTKNRRAIITMVSNE